MQMNEMKSYTAEYARMEIGAKQEIRGIQARRQNESARIVGEQLMESRLQEQQKASRQQNRLAEQTNLIAQELEKQNAEQERRMREIQRICNESEELRELESRLKLAYMNKERADQYLEKQRLQAFDAHREAAIEDKMEYDRQMALQREAEEARRRYEQGLQQKAALQQQMADREKLLREAALEAERDKSLVDQVVQKIMAEDRKEYEDKYNRRNMTKQMIQEAEQIRLREIEAKRRADHEEEMRIRQYQESKQAHQAELARVKAEEEAVKARLFEQLSAEKKAAVREEEEMQRIRDLLWEEELELQRQRIEEERQRKIVEAKMEMMKANEQMQALKAMRRQQEIESEQRLVQIMQQKFRKDEERERQEAWNREVAKQEYMRKINEQKEERAALYQQEIAAELASLEMQREREAYKAQVIAEARQRLLEQHAEVLNGYAPKGIIQSPDELDRIRQVASRGSSRGSQISSRGSQYGNSYRY